MTPPTPTPDPTAAANLRASVNTHRDRADREEARADALAGCLLAIIPPTVDAAAHVHLLHDPAICCAMAADPIDPTTRTAAARLIAEWHHDRTGARQ